MEFRAAIYMSFKKTQCSLSFIVINVITINFDEINTVMYCTVLSITLYETYYTTTLLYFTLRALKDSYTLHSSK
jgi:hypothetical protein